MRKSVCECIIPRALANGCVFQLEVILMALSLITSEKIPQQKQTSVFSSCSTASTMASSGAGAPCPRNVATTVRSKREFFLAFSSGMASLDDVSKTQDVHARESLSLHLARVLRNEHEPLHSCQWPVRGDVCLEILARQTRDPTCPYPRGRPHIQRRNHLHGR